MQTDIIGHTPGVDAGELHLEMERIASVQLGRTLGALAKGLPVYNVTFHGEERVEVRPGGIVGE